MLNLDYANALRLMLPQEKDIALVLIGCGGTGSWLASAVARAARLLKELKQAETTVYFVDPDYVEPKNIFRQNFCDAEIGNNKAETLAFRYGTAWGIKITAVPEEYSTRFNAGNVFVLYIGCVDNAQARAEIAKRINESSTKKAWWLDCGNVKSMGQILFGTRLFSSQDPFALKGFSSYAPLPSVQHPELLVPEPETKLDTRRMSCAEIALADPQGLGINQTIASIASDYLFRGLITNDLRKFATYVDLEAGSASSKYATKEALEGYFHLVEDVKK